MIKHVVVAAVIRSLDGERIYIQQREVEKEYASKWELPGGKVEDGESFETALVRELEEELRPVQDSHSDERSSDFYIKNFIGAVVKTSTVGDWNGQQYLLMFFEVRLESKVTINPSAKFLWIDKHQIESFKDKLIDNYMLQILFEQFGLSNERKSLARENWIPCPICQSDYDGVFCHACRNTPWPEWKRLAEPEEYLRFLENKLIEIKEFWNKVHRLKSVSDRDGRWVAYYESDIKEFKKLLESNEPKENQKTILSTREDQTEQKNIQDQSDSE